MNNLFYLPPLVIFLLWISLGELVEGKYPVIVDDLTTKFSRRLYGRSTVVYQNKMYVYGGKTVSKALPTNEMYVYDFETDPNAARMSRVNQTNIGPICFFCGAVMIDDHRMMILTKDVTSALENINTVVKPHIFDFETFTWSVDDRAPVYNVSLRQNYQVRLYHTTVLGRDGMIYTIGGVDFYFANTTQNSWYYNPVDNSYGMISNNGFLYTAVMSHNSFVLSDTTIGSIYGRNASSSKITYFPTDVIMVIDTITKSWVAPIKIRSNSLLSPGLEGAASVVFGQGRYVYISGGAHINMVSGDINRNDIVIDLENRRTDVIVIEPLDYYLTPRIYGSLAIISNEYLVVAFGLSWFSGSSEVSYIDMIRLPEMGEDGRFLKSINSSNGTWVTSMSKDFISDSKELKKRLSTPIILLIIFAILITICLSILALAIIYRKELSGRRNLRRSKFYAKGILRSIWPRRVGETFSSQLFNFLTRIVLLMALLGFVIYFVYSIINSPISSTDSFEEKETIEVPDIRFCYSGWYYNSIYDPGEIFPDLVCQNLKSRNTSFGCSEVVTLNRNMSMPSFPGQKGDTKCDMTRGGNGNSVVSKDSPELIFNHIGLITSQNQAVYIQFYEHEKNPNRVVYLDETIPNFDVEAADKWLESEFSSNSNSEIVNRVVTVYLNTYASIQFETVYTNKLDPNSAWNYIGIFPKYIKTSELSITHTNIMKYDTVISTDAEAPKTWIGEIKVSPASFTVKTITENKDVTLISALGVFAGIVSFLLAIQVILFGARPVDPWGLFQKSSLRAYRKDKKRKELERHFGIPEVKSIPFITPVHKRFAPIYNLSSEEDQNEKLDGTQELLHERIFTDVEPDLNSKNLELDSLVSGYNDLKTRLSQLEGRNQILELVLKSYYLDDKIFRELYPAPNNEGSSIEKEPSIEEELSIDRNSTIQEKRYKPFTFNV